MPHSKCLGDSTHTLDVEAVKVGRQPYSVGVVVERAMASASESI